MEGSAGPSRRDSFLSHKHFGSVPSWPGGVGGRQGRKGTGWGTWMLAGISVTCPWGTLLSHWGGTNGMLMFFWPWPFLPTSPHFFFQGSEASGDWAHLACSQVSLGLSPGPCPQTPTLGTAHGLSSSCALRSLPGGSHLGWTLLPELRDWQPPMGSPVVPQHHFINHSWVTPCSRRPGGTRGPHGVCSRGQRPRVAQPACPELRGTLVCAAACDTAGWPGM